MATHTGQTEQPDIITEVGTGMSDGDPAEWSDAQWRERLDPDAYRILREKGTERAFTGRYWDTTTPGTYQCAGCGTELFRSEAKFNSHCGWPSFTQPSDEAAVLEHQDLSYGMSRVETVCAKCGGHLGHVFTDGPAPGGLRYCINSASIDLVED